MVITPRTPEPEYLYDHVDGRDLLGVLFEDHRVGSVLIPLTAYTAAHVAAHLQGMLGQLDELRHESLERNR